MLVRLVVCGPVRNFGCQTIIARRRRKAGVGVGRPNVRAQPQMCVATYVKTRRDERYVTSTVDETHFRHPNFERETLLA
jgi:hypothetical protein